MPDLYNLLYVQYNLLYVQIYPALIQKLLSFRLLSGSLMTMNPPEDFFGVVEVFFFFNVDLDFLGKEGSCVFFNEDAFSDLEDTREDLSTDKEVKGSADFFRDEDFCVF